MPTSSHMASFPAPVEYKIVRIIQSVRTYVTELDQSNTPDDSLASESHFVTLKRDAIVGYDNTVCLSVSYPVRTLDIMFLNSLLSLIHSVI